MLIEPFSYPEMFYNEVIYHMEEKWQRRLTDHEKHLLREVYNFARTVAEANELKFLWAK